MSAQHIRPYGDTRDDGRVQVSFSLPMPYGEEAKEAARMLAAQMGLGEPQVVHAKDLGEGMTFFVVFGNVRYTVDVSQIRVAKIEAPKLTMDEINERIRRDIGRKIVVIGACTGTDAHTVGIDAIMNMKGYAGEYGLERYPMIDAYNLGAQVANEDLVDKMVELQADAVLVSQVVTQKDVHVHNLTQLVDLLEAQGIRDRVLLICGGPRMSHELALELGYDAGFGSGTLAPDVASFIVEEISRKTP